MPFPEELTATQKRTMACVSCQLAQPRSRGALNEITYECTGLGRSTTQQTLEKYYENGLLGKTLEHTDGDRRGGRRMFYSPTEAGKRVITPQVAPGCTRFEIPSNPADRVPDYFTANQRQLLGCIACMHNRYKDVPNRRQGITKNEATACSQQPAPTVNHFFMRAIEYGYIYGAHNVGRQIIYKASPDAVPMLEAIMPATCGLPEQTEPVLDPDPARAAVLRCMACLSLRRQDTEEPILSPMIKQCTGLTRSPLYNSIEYLEAEGYLNRIFDKPQPQQFRIEPTPKLDALITLKEPPEGCAYTE